MPRHSLEAYTVSSSAAVHKIASPAWRVLVRTWSCTEIRYRINEVNKVRTYCGDLNTKNDGYFPRIPPLTGIGAQCQTNSKDDGRAHKRCGLESQLHNVPSLAVGNFRTREPQRKMLICASAISKRYRRLLLLENRTILFLSDWMRRRQRLR